MVAVVPQHKGRFVSELVVAGDYAVLSCEPSEMAVHITDTGTEMHLLPMKGGVNLEPRCLYSTGVS